MPRFQQLPQIWIISDMRNDSALEQALARLPRGSALIYRHYHLAPAPRRARFRMLARAARSKGHLIVLAGTMRQARRWGADGAYGSTAALAGGPAGLRLATAHSLREIGRVGRADAVLLSPVHLTRSHPDGKMLGPVRFRLLAAQAQVSVIALGGMDAARAHALKWPHWAAIDAFCDEATRWISLDS